MPIHSFLAPIIARLEAPAQVTADPFPHKGADTIEWSLPRGDDGIEVQAEYWVLGRGGYGEATGRLQCADGSLLEATDSEIEDLNDELSQMEAYRREYDKAQRQWSKTRDGYH